MDDARPLFARRLSRRQLIAVDVVAAVALTSAYPVWAGGAGIPRWAAVAIPLGLGLSLGLRRIWPRTVFCVVLVLSAAASGTGLVAFGFVAPAYALYVVATDARWGTSLPTTTIAGIALAAPAVLTMVGSPQGGWARHLGDAVLGVAVLAGTWTVGRAVAERRSYAARDAERRAGEAVAQERLRISRELHDVVAHSMGLIAVKAGVANHVLHTRPEEAHDALRVIESASREALAEMRHLLGVLRTAPPDLRPVPGLAGLPELVARAESAGVAVELDVRHTDGLPEGVELSTYRIVQEALTNVVKHAAPARCRVLIEADGREVRIEAVDDGVGPMSSGCTEGHGLVGMRERVAMFGGVLDAGPRRDGPGFRVRATLPYGEPA